MKMRLTKLFIAMLLGVAGMNLADAQVTRYNVDVDAFNSIKASNDFKLKFVKGDSYSVEATVNEILKDFVQIAVTDGVLNVYFEDKKVTAEVMKPFRGRNAAAPIFDVVVTCPSVIKNLELLGNAVVLDFAEVADTSAINISISENAKIESATIKSSELNLSTHRRGSCKMDVNADKFTLSAKGSAELTINQDVKDSDVTLGSNISLQLNGKSETLNFTSSGTCKSILNGESSYTRFNISGSSNINALNLNSKEANVNMNSICVLSINASEWIFINISNGSSLTYSGEPQIHINSIRNASVLRYNDSK